MSDEVLSAIISCGMSFFITLITYRYEDKKTKKTNKKDEMFELISDNKILFNEIYKIAYKNNYVNISILNEELEKNLARILLLPKKLKNLFNEIYQISLLTGTEVIRKETEMRNLSRSIIEYINKIGVDVSDIKD